MTGMVRVMVTTRGVAGMAADPAEIELPSGSTVAAVLDLVLAGKRGPKPDTDPKIFRNVIATVNGRYVPFSEVEETVLAAGDQINVMPLIVGG
jgi:sulfur carrier protein ThiS